MSEYSSKNVSNFLENNSVEFLDVINHDKKIILVFTLLFSLSAFLFSLQSKPYFSSQKIIEIGTYTTSKGVDEIIEHPLDLAKHLKILKYKSQLNESDNAINPINNNISSISFNDVGDKILEINYSYYSDERNTMIDEIEKYILDRHSSIQKSLIAESKIEIEKKIAFIDSKNNLDKIQYQRLESDVINYEALVKSLQSENEQSNENLGNIFILQESISRIKDSQYDIQKLIRRDVIEKNELEKQIEKIIPSSFTKTISDHTVVNPNQKNLIYMFLGTCFGFFFGFFIALLKRFFKNIKKS